jgi:FAD binding domain/Berberine and berberine like
VDRIDRHEFLVKGAQLAIGGAALGLTAAAPALAKSGPPLAELRKAIGAGRLLVPGDYAYGATRVPWNRRYDSVKPIAIALPGSAAQVAACVKWADKHDVPFAVRSGGHSFAGQSSSKGLVIDLRRLAGISPSGDKARIGAGARLGAVYTALWAAGHRTIPGGTAPTVGVAGLTLGGGHGFLARDLGLACDNVVAMEVVTADGKVRTCNATSNKDLFWALRGAGFGSFGVVTSLTFKTTKLGPVTTVALEWEWPRAPEIVASWTTFMATAPDELSTVLALRVPAIPGGVPRLAVNGLFAGTKAEAQAAIEPLLTATMPTKVTVVERAYDAAVHYFEGSQSATRRFVGAASGYAKTPLTADGRAALVDLVAERHANPSLRNGGAVLFALGGAVGRVPKSGTAFVHRDARFSVELVGLWDAPATSAANIAWINHARATMRPYLSGEAVQNYADPALGDWRKAYYGANLARLVKVKKAVDPGNLFRHTQSIPLHL